MESEETRLPKGWVAVPLAQAIQPRGEKVSPSNHPQARFIGMDHVESHSTKILASLPASAMKSSAARFHSGDVLYGRLRPYLNKVAQPNFDGLASAEFIVFPDTELIKSHFLKHRLNAADFVSFATHLNEGDRPRVSFDQIGEFEILIPPPPEQHRIVAKIEELFSGLDKGIESLRTAREQLKVYRQVVLKHAFEGRLTKEWRSEHLTGDSLEWSETPLGSILSLVTSGSRGWATYYSTRGDIFIRAQNLKHDRLALDDVAFVSLPNGKTSEGTRTRVQAGDVLITITGANVTKTGFVREDIGTAYVSQHVALARPTEAISPEFLYWFLVAEAGGRRQLNAAAYGAGKPGLNLDNIRSVIVPLPNLAEQAEIVRRMSRLLSFADSADIDIDLSLQKTQALRQAILKAAFSGRLAEQDPNDEPASALLQRIRVKKKPAEEKARRTRKKRTAV